MYCKHKSFISWQRFIHYLKDRVIFIPCEDKKGRAIINYIWFKSLISKPNGFGCFLFDFSMYNKP